MKIFTENSENSLGKLGNIVADVPDVVEWIYEHEAIVSVCERLHCVKRVLDEAGYDEELHFFADAEGELMIGDEVRHLLRATCDDEHWQYCENYLFK